MLDNFISAVTGKSQTPQPDVAANASISTAHLPILVDTSAIIDGRIAGVAEAGFIPGVLLVPRFVLAELQNIADSSDPMRRGRGRRGLEMLNSIRQGNLTPMEVIEEDAPEIKEVDAKLVRIARNIGANILTTDYNLNRVAAIEGVRVLNVNELSNAIRPVVLPGEHMRVQVVQPGKERNQGVGYLPDGTMIVVDGGDKIMGQEVTIEVTRVLQTVAGKMLFAKPLDGTASAAPTGRKLAATKVDPNAPLPELPVEAPTEAKPEAKKAEGKPRNPRPRGRRGAGGGNKPVEAKAGEAKPDAKPRPPRNNDRPRRKRMNPTQKLEDSLMNLTSGE